MASLYQITAGFMPLLDSAVLVAAKELDFAEEEGIDLTLVREMSWANIRDRLAVGHFQVAHMLAPMPIACNLGLTPLAVPTIVPMALGLGGNAVTVSNALWQAMTAQGAKDDFEPTTNGNALREVVRTRSLQNKTPLRFAVVHPYSGHNYELRYWLAACGIDPSRDIEIVIVPPPLMLDALGSGTIDGYCVGEPWNSAAALLGQGHIATVKAAIWRSSPEKVLAAGEYWAKENAEALSALLRALSKASKWCADARNIDDLARVLAEKVYVAQPVEWMLPALQGRLPVEGERAVAVSDFFVPFAKAATFPWKSHALWFYSQMVRWRQVPHSSENAKIARETYRPDLYRAALKASGIALPVANSKVEGALTALTPVGSSGASLVLGPDGFFDGGLFDPDKLDAYIASQKQ